MEIISITTIHADKDKQTSSAYDIRGKENTSRTSEKKEKAREGYVCIYECGKNLLHSAYEHACSAQKTTIIQIN